VVIVNGDFPATNLYKAALNGHFAFIGRPPELLKLTVIDTWE
jgi:hypothetical protein